MNNHSVVLAQNAACTIEHCSSCDALHVTVGPITIRMQLEAAELLGEALVESVQALPADPGLRRMLLFSGAEQVTQ